VKSKTVYRRKKVKTRCACTKEQLEDMTLEEHAEAWWKEQGKIVPARGTSEHDAMYKAWCSFAFKDF
jgi:hypothetical protein